MLDLKSSKFNSLSVEAKLLITTSMSSEIQITNNVFFYNVLGLNYPDDEMKFHQIITEINNSNINYKIEKIKFIPPTRDQSLFFLLENKNKLKITLSSSEIEVANNIIYDFYESKKWRTTKGKIKNWKFTFIRAITTWDFNFNKKQKESTKVDEAVKSYNDFKDNFLK